MTQCLTKQLMFREASGCLVEKPECGYALKFGFSFVCCHPEHTKFHADVVGALTKKESGKLYDSLKRQRRDEFIANLDEPGKKYFCYETDFLGQPVAVEDQTERLAA